MYLTENCHAPQFDELFPVASRDAFHESAVLSAISSKWHSILIVDGPRAFHNSFAPRLINGSDLFDIEPFVGYAGPLSTTHDKNFLADAFKAYSEACRGLNIVAELIRFDPLLNNQVAFLDLHAIDVVPAKQVIIVNCPNDVDELLAEFSQRCRYYVRVGLRRYKFARLEGSAGLLEFRALYEASVKRLGSGSSWLFSDELYLQASRSELFATYGVYDGDRLVSAALVIHHPTCSHGMLLGQVDDCPQGVSELLNFEIARESANRSISHYMLGGGITSAPEDSLLRFKQKFAKSSSIFYLGKLLHDGKRYRDLCANAVAKEPRLASSSFFLKYRLLEKHEAGRV